MKQLTLSRKAESISASILVQTQWRIKPFFKWEFSELYYNPNHNNFVEFAVFGFRQKLETLNDDIVYD